MKRRAVITGIGAVTPIGTGRAALWAGVLRARSAARPVSRFDASAFRSQLAAEVDDFCPGDFLDARATRRVDRFSQFALAASRMAVDDAALDLSGCERDRAGVSLGSALGGIAYGEEQHSLFLDGGLRAVGPMLAIAVYGGASGANVAIDLDLRGPNLANASSCASGAVAIGDALRLIQRDEADVVLAGGAEAPLAPLTFGAFSLIKAMSSRNDDPACASRPFDRDRDGFVMAEGAAVLCIEERQRALCRGAHIYAELRGFGHTNDAYHMTAPRPDGGEAARALTLALRDASVPPDQIGYVNAHATGTPLGDLAEACAIRRALSPHGSEAPVSSTKGLYGHALGASGAIEVAITAMALDYGFLPGTLNLDEAEERCALNLIPPGGIGRSARFAASTSFGFGGVNAALILGAAGEE